MEKNVLLSFKQLPDGAWRTNGYLPNTVWKGESKIFIGPVPSPKEHAQNLLWKSIQKDLTASSFSEFSKNLYAQKRVD